MTPTQYFDEALSLFHGLPLYHTDHLILANRAVQLRIWVELGEQLKVFSLYQTAKIEPENLHQRFEYLKPFIKNKAEYQPRISERPFNPSSIIKTVLFG